MNLDRLTIARSGYTFLDVLSDVGGIQGLLLSFFSALLGFLNYGLFDSQLTSRLFRLKNSSISSKEAARVSVLKTTDPIEVQRCCNTCSFCQDKLPAKCRVMCCIKSRSKKGLDKAIQKLDNETNIIKIVKSRRYFKAALKMLLSREKR